MSLEHTEYAYINMGEVSYASGVVWEVCYDTFFAASPLGSIVSAVNPCCLLRRRKLQISSPRFSTQGRVLNVNTFFIQSIKNYRILKAEYLVRFIIDMTCNLRAFLFNEKKRFFRKKTCLYFSMWGKKYFFISASAQAYISNNTQSNLPNSH